MIRRQVQQRKRLVCELKAVERELKAVEVFFLKPFSSNSKKSKISSSLQSSRSFRHGEKWSACVQMCDSVCDSFVKLVERNRSIHAATLTTTCELTTGSETVSMRKTFNKRGLVSQNARLTCRQVKFKCKHH